MFLTSLKTQLETSFWGNLKYVDIIWGSPTGRNFKTRSMLLDQSCFQEWLIENNNNNHKKITKNKQRSHKFSKDLSKLQFPGRLNKKLHLFLYMDSLTLANSHYTCVNSVQVSSLFSGVLINMNTLILRLILYCPNYQPFTILVAHKNNPEKNENTNVSAPLQII